MEQVLLICRLACLTCLRIFTKIENIFAWMFYRVSLSRKEISEDLACENTSQFPTSQIKVFFGYGGSITKYY